MKTIKSLSLVLLSTLALNAYGMKEGIVQRENGQETDSRPVPSLRDLCVARIVELIKQDPEFCEKEGQPQLTHHADEQVAAELMSNHPIIPLILQKLEIAPKASFVHTDKTDKVCSVAFSPDGKQILTASRAAKLWDKNTGSCIQTFTGHTDKVHSAAFSPDGKQILTASQDHTAKLWNKETGSCIQTFTGHTCWVWSAVFSPDGSQILTASFDGTAKLWDKNTGSCIQTFTYTLTWGKLSSVYSAVFSPDGSQILTASCSSEAKLWNKDTGACIHTFTAHPYSEVFNSGRVSPDGSHINLFNCTGKWVNSKTRAYIHTFTSHRGDFQSAVFSPDGSQILTAAQDSTAKLWDVTPILWTHYILTHGLSIQQANLLNKINKSTANGRKLILNECSAEVFNSLDPEIQKALSEYVIKKSFAATVPCTIV